MLGRGIGAPASCLVHCRIWGVQDFFPQGISQGKSILWLVPSPWEGVRKGFIYLFGEESEDVSGPGGCFGMTPSRCPPVSPYLTGVAVLLLPRFLLLLLRHLALPPAQPAARSALPLTMALWCLGCARLGQAALRGQKTELGAAPGLWDRLGRGSHCSTGWERRGTPCPDGIWSSHGAFGAGRMLWQGHKSAI